MLGAEPQGTVSPPPHHRPCLYSPASAVGFKLPTTRPGIHQPGVSQSWQARPFGAEKPTVHKASNAHHDDTGPSRRAAVLVDLAVRR